VVAHALSFDNYEYFEKPAWASPSANHRELHRRAQSPAPDGNGAVIGAGEEVQACDILGIKFESNFLHLNASFPFLFFISACPQIGQVMDVFFALTSTKLNPRS